MDGSLNRLCPQCWPQVPGTERTSLAVYPLMNTLGDHVIGLWDSHHGSFKCPPLGVQVR